MVRTDAVISIGHAECQNLENKSLSTIVLDFIPVQAHLGRWGDRNLSFQLLLRKL